MDLGFVCSRVSVSSLKSTRITAREKAFVAGATGGVITRFPFIFWYVGLQASCPGPYKKSPMLLADSGLGDLSNFFFFRLFLAKVAP